MRAAFHQDSYNKHNGSICGATTDAFRWDMDGQIPLMLEQNAFRTAVTIDTSDVVFSRTDARD